VARFEYELTVSSSVIDENGHANNVEYLRWMQDAAIAHSDLVGCSGATLADEASWFVRSHHIEYLSPAKAGDRVVVRTWVVDMRRVASLRRYEIVRADGKQMLARGETDWVYIDRATGKPKTIADPIRTMFGVIERS